jgi:hypothetical protein
MYQPPLPTVSCPNKHSVIKQEEATHLLLPESCSPLCFPPTPPVLRGLVGFAAPRSPSVPPVATLCNTPQMLFGRRSLWGSLHPSPSFARLPSSVEALQLLKPPPRSLQRLRAVHTLVAAVLRRLLFWLLWQMSSVAWRPLGVPPPTPPSGRGEMSPRSCLLSRVLCAPRIRWAYDLSACDDAPCVSAQLLPYMSASLACTKTAARHSVRPGHLWIVD